MALIDDVKAAYRAVARGMLTDAEANAIMAQIAADALTLESYIANLTKQAASTTSAAIAIASFVTGVSPTSDKLDALKIEADKQVASYMKMGVGDPSLGAFEAFGKGFAEDPATGFASKYGAMSESEFINNVYAAVYGGAPSDGAFQNLASQIAAFMKLYSDAGLANAALLAKGAVLGQIVGYAFTDPVAAEKSKLDDQVNKLLVSAAKGDASVFGKPLPSLDPTPPPNNGGGGTPIDPPQTFELTDDEDKFTGGTGDDIFNAPGDVTTTLTDNDALDGGGGIDTLNIHYDAQHPRKNFHFPQATVRNIEVVNVIDHTVDPLNNAASTSLSNPANYEGVKELWQTNRAAYNQTNWKADVVAGFRNIGAFDVTAASGERSISVGVDYDTISGSQRYVSAYLHGDALDTFIVKKSRDASPQADPVQVTLWLDLDPALKTLRIQSDLAANLASQSIRAAPHLEVFDASASAGGVSPGLFIDPTTHTIKGGAGNDGFSIVTDTSADNPATPNIDETITATLSAGAGNDVAFLITTGSGRTIVDMGPGDDVLKYFPSTSASVDLGDGDDIFEVRSGSPRTGDVIKGGAGVDRFEQMFSAWTQQGVLFDGVEKFTFRSGSVVDATGWIGVKELHAQNGPNGVNAASSEFSGMTSDVVIHIENNLAVTANFADKANANNSATFVTHTQAWTITAQQIENITIDLQQGWLYSVTQNPALFAPQLKTLTLKGAGDVDAMSPHALRDLPNLTKIDAHDLAGKLEIASLFNVASGDLAIVAPSSHDTYIEIVSIGGALTFTGGSGRDYVHGTARADTINMGDGGGEIFGEGGADQITLGAGAFILRALGSSRIGAMAEATGFNAQGADVDYIHHLTAPATFAPNAAGAAAVTALGGSATLLDAATAFFAAAGSGVWASWFVFKGDTYVVSNALSDGFQANDDMIIRLIGVTDFSAANIY